MSDTTHTFLIPDHWTPTELAHALEPLGEVTTGPVERCDWTFFDTFDGRLYCAGTVLVEERHPDGTVTSSWRRQGATEALAVEEAPVPQFPRELPPGPLQDGLAALTGVRALLPLVGGHGRTLEARLLNEDGKTVVRFRLSEHRVRQETGDAEVALPHRLQVLPVRGYRRPLAESLALLAAEGFPATAEELALAARVGLGHPPAPGPPRFRPLDDPALPTWQALRLLFHQLLAAIEANRPGAAAALDPEFLHDLRVAVRRPRALLGQFKEFLPEPQLRRFRAGFAWLGKATGPGRDLDVYLLGFTQYQALLPPAYRNDLLPLRDYLETRRQREQVLLRRALNGRHYRQLVEDWQTLLEGAPPRPGSRPAAAFQSIEARAGERIDRLARRAFRQGAAIDADTPAAALHQLRITCKKLRYLLESFQGLFATGPITTLIRDLKRLQDNLGVFQDLSVQSAALEHFATAMTAAGTAPPPTLLAMGMLLEILVEQRRQVRAEFAARFARFAGKKSRARLRRLFRQEKCP